MKLQNLILIPILFVYMGLLPKAQAIFPPPDGDYPGGNTAEGKEALLSLTDGTYNTAVGFFSLRANRSGNFNTAIGFEAGFNQTTGSSNVYIGSNILGTDGESNTCYIASIFGQTSASGIPVLINSDNKLGTTTSSKRFKEDIKPMGETSETLKSKAVEIAGDQIEKASSLATDVVETVAEEARKEGLTIDSAKAAMSDLSGKVGRMVDAAGKSVSESVR